MVSGSMRSPFWVRSQPLKSPHHTRFGALAEAKGVVYGSIRRRFRRARTSPSRRNNSPMVLAAGQVISGCWRASTTFSLRGPQRMCGCRSSTICCSISADIWLG